MLKLLSLGIGLSLLRNITDGHGAFLFSFFCAKGTRVLSRLMPRRIRVPAQLCGGVRNE